MPDRPTVCVPWSDLDLPGVTGVAVYDGGGEPDVAALRAVELYVVPYGGPGRALDLVRELPALRAVQVLSAGYEDVLPLLPDGVALHNGRGLHDASTAEHAVALVLAAQRELPRWHADQASQAWDPASTRSLAGSRVLVVGYGSIGAALAARLEPFEVDLTLVAPRARPAEGVHGVEDLHDLLPRADVVVVVTPLTDDTRGLVGERELALMPDGALLVNVGRGAVVDTAALLAHAGRVRAALDVTDPEPLPSGHPLWDAPGVTITPHVAGGSATFVPRARAFVAAQVRRWVTGEPLLNHVEGDQR